MLPTTLSCGVGAYKASNETTFRIQKQNQQQQQPQQEQEQQQQTMQTTSCSKQQQQQQSKHAQLQRNLLIGLILTAFCAQSVLCADLAISIPNNQGLDNVYYRIDYSPPYGDPAPNTTIPSREIGEEIQFSHALPGTKYNFWLYYTNYTHPDVLSWTVTITTAPDPPSNLSVQVRSGKNAIISWSPPTQGNYTSFRIKVLGLSGASNSYNRTFVVNNTFQHSVKELTPGATYQVQAFTVYDNKESVAYTSRNFTTKPNTPGKFIVWFRNETTLLVLWQPPYPAGIYTHYKVSIEPPDALESVLYVEKEGEPPGPAQAAFKGLVPGRAYNISVQTMSEDEISPPTTAQYRTVPLRPLNVTFGKVTSWPAAGDVTLRPLPVRNLRSFNDDKTNTMRITWEPDLASTQDEYRIAYHELETFNGDTSTFTEERPSTILESLLPGRNYSVSVQAVSKKMESNETTIYVVTRPSSPIIEDLKSIRTGLNISWKSDVNSKQEKYEVLYSRNGTSEVRTIDTKDSRLVITNLHAGAGYEVKVFAVSHGLRSEPHAYFQAVFSNPPRNMSIETVRSNSVLVHWAPPENSDFTEYSMRYRTETKEQWFNLPSVRATEAEITDMTKGEKYTIQVNTVSFGVESPNPQEVVYTVPPNEVSNIIPLVDSRNITLEWPKPEGRVESYILKWWPTENSSKSQTKTVSENKSDESSTVRVLIGDLMPGVQYKFDIQTTSYGIFSRTTHLSTRTMPLIQSEVVVVNDRQEDERDTITLSYTPTPQSSSKFDIYRFSLGDPDIKDKEKLANDTDRKVTFTGLIPGRLYNITVWTVSGGVSSLPIQRQDRLFPEPITQLHATNITDTEISLKWDIPKGEYNDFDVQYLTADNILAQNITTRNEITIADLRPHRNYTFTVVVRSGTESSVLRSSSPLSASFSTNEAVPGRVERFHPIDVQPSEIVFEWLLPTSEANGVIRQFSITYMNVNNATERRIQQFESSDVTGTIRNLKPGETYIFKIQAKTSVGYGPEREYKQTMPILAPPRPATQVVPTEVYRSSQTIQIRFRKNYFSDQNGPVRWYTIIVAEDDAKNASGLEMPSWHDVQSYSVWLPYQAIDPYYPFENRSVEDFTIGTENCDNRKLGYCNGPLKSGTTYRVKVRAFTAPDKFTDTAYSFPIQTDQDNTSLIVAITVPLTIIFVLLITLFVFKRRRNSCRKATKNSRANDNMSLPDSVIEQNRPILIKNFAEHYRLMSADSDFRFSEEFEELKHVGRDQSCTFADLPCNRPKNRFTNILPYDHSRFKLQPVDDDEGSDYINANYVPGHNSPREFIVTQGPLHSTRDDFWRMCWESNSRAIVMLTRCFEKGREKCDQYWPNDTVPVFYGDIKVQILNDSHYADWVMTEFMLCRGSEQRIMRHFHFTTWPDFGVPNPPQTLVRFVRAFRDRIGSEQRPIVVHCSAGVGRSGTFITLDRILQQIKTSDFVDIFGIVFAMRKERVWMVQTEQQYICIHQCLLAVLEGKENIVGPAREIHDNEGYEDDEGIAESGM
uniref:protein-tyrosine-phosphatase n=1 Tax=Bactrocera latifrons TaxID=174628 RepID=A0A0K8UW28_BACLA